MYVAGGSRTVVACEPTLGTLAFGAFKAVGNLLAAVVAALDAALDGTFDLAPGVLLPTLEEAAAEWWA